MKWSFVIQQKLKAALLLSSIMVLIVLNGLISKNSMDSIDQSFSSIYQDRLIPVVDIVYLSEHLYGKRFLLEKGLSNKNATELSVLVRQLNTHNQKIDSLITEFEKTFLVEEEVKALAAFKKHTSAYLAIENTVLKLDSTALPDAGKELFHTQGTLAFQKSIRQLTELTKIQSAVGQELMKKSHTKAYLFNLLSTLQIAFAITIAFLILGLIHNSKILNKDKTPFHLN